MKYTNKFLGALCLAAFGFASCADDYSLLDYEGIEKPVDMAAYEYLKDYNDLKSYVDRSASPNFKLGTGITASQYNEGGLVQRLAVNNFDEVTPGNAMKHASVVGNDGSMNFGTVSDFVSNARAAGQTIYGHTLLWHAQQNTKYLNNLIAPQIIKPEKPEGSTPNFAMRLNNTEVQSPVYEAQAQIAMDPVMEAGKTYVIKMAAKASAACTIGGVVQENVEPWPQVAYPDIDLTTEWAEYEVEVTAEGAYNCFCINFGNFVGDIWVDNIVVAEKGSNTNLISNGDFEGGNTSGWNGCWNRKATINITGEGEGYSPAANTSGGHALVLTNSAAGADNWSAQTWYNLPVPMEAGSYTLTFTAKATAAYNMVLFTQTAADGSQDMFYGSPMALTEEWAEVTMTFSNTATRDKLTFNFGDFEGSIFIDNISLVAEGDTENLIANSDFENGTIDGWTGWESGKYEKLSEDGEGYSTGAEPGYAMILTPTTSDADGNNWSAQTWYVFDEPLVNGNTYTLSFMAKATENYTMAAWFKMGADGDQIYHQPGNFNITTDWAEVTNTFTVGNDGVDRFIFNFGDFKGEKIYIDNIKFVEDGGNENFIKNGDFEEAHVDGWAYWTPGVNYAISEKGEGYAANASADIIIEKTPEEKAFFLTAALDSWVAGIMQATEGYVTSWDAVNEIISGEDADGDGFYDLRSASNADADTKSNFYWADYLGNETVVPTVIKMAHKHYSGDGSLKLFINDFNLESWWDDNQKLKSLIHWIEVWESSDIIKIDGIGTQMHVSYILNEEDQKKQEAAIENMFKLMAATGKLVKISELDMGVVEKAFGEGIRTENITEEMHMKMADFYQFIIKKYFELIPADQQYGITHWCPTDSPADSGWRAGQPVGLWDKNYNRKHVYAGFADGLAGVEDEEVEDDVESAE